MGMFRLWGSNAMNLSSENEKNNKVVSRAEFQRDYTLGGNEFSDLSEINQTITVKATAIYCSNCESSMAFLNPVSGNHICLNCERVF